MSILIKNAKIIDDSSEHHLKTKDILIENGIIKKISDNITPENITKILEFQNLHISCGWFDSSVCFGEPGFEERETIENGLSVASKSGFTSIALNGNTSPIIDSKSDINFLINKSENCSTKLYPIGALTKEYKGIELAELYDMQKSGAVAFGDYNSAIDDDNLLKIALQYAQNFNGLILSFPKNNKIAGEGVANEGYNSTMLGLKGIPSLAEELQISRDLSILKYTGGKLHIPTITTKKSIELIKQAKKDGLNVTCSVSVHHLILTDDELKEFDSNYKTTPPLRTISDVKALREGVISGVIDCITSDHNPIDIENKKVEFSEAKDGVIGLETAFGILNQIFDLNDFIPLLTNKPKDIFGLKNNSIKEGNPADLSLFNPSGSYNFIEEKILSTSKNTPFINKQMKGSVYGVFSNSILNINK